jgi:hypothetical protein
MIERAAFAIYRTFIAGGIGTCQWKRDAEGNLVKDRAGNSVRETPDEAAERRWFACPETTRARFRHEAVAAVNAWEQAA